MKTFHCTHCQNLVFFENVRCLNCGRSLAFLPDRGVMAALTPDPDGRWTAEIPGGNAPGYRLCANYDGVSVCNWVISPDDTGDFCRSCRLNQVIPDLSSEHNAVAWFRLEVAKRRMLYTLLGFGLPVIPKSLDAAQGLAFEFLEDYSDGDAKRVLTGHDNGLITLNIAEADDVHREKERTLQKEPYRTLLGHFRHEIGHYFWDRLVAGGSLLEAFRTTFGDERADYQAALQLHYRDGPPAHWERHFISAYATTHPWEDWAECWAHYMHMVDAVETAGAAGLTLRPKRSDEPRMQPPPDPLNPSERNFDSMIEAWLSLTYVLNNLSRGLGLPDSYPFVLSLPVIAKLRFIHDTIDQRAFGDANGWSAVRAPAPATTATNAAAATAETASGATTAPATATTAAAATAQTPPATPATSS